MEIKICTMRNIEKLSKTFTKNIQIEEIVIAKEAQYVILETKTIYQVNQNYIMEKIEMSFYKNKRIDKSFKEKLRSYVELV